MSPGRDKAASPHDVRVRQLTTVRDTVESIGIAVVLAFVLRAFLIEAFVIPTGSMAPRLMGEHWRLQCPVCGYEYDHGWVQGSSKRDVPKLPVTARCPNCNQKYTANRGQAVRVDGGDRVLVLKYLYNFRRPQPWDVVVFRNPQNNRENYIKRLVGLPGETIELIHGDVWVKGNDQAPWTIRRKPPGVQEEMWQVIYDNDYRATNPTEPDLVPIWLDPDDTGRWDLSGDQGRKFTFLGDGGPSGLEFHARRGDANERLGFLPHYGYNSIRSESDRRANQYLHMEICTDLRLSFVYMPQSHDSRVVLMLDAMDKGYAAEISADGSVRLLHRPSAAESLLADGDPASLSGWVTWQQASLPPLEVGRGHEVALSNVDYRLTLWIDGRAVLESTAEQYPADHDEIQDLMLRVHAGDSRISTPQVAIAAAGGPADLLHVKLERDVYYTHARLEAPGSNPNVASGYWDYYRGLSRDEADDSGWGVTDHTIRLNGDSSAPNDLDSFFVLGDNSPQSLDGRRWTRAAPTLRLYEDDQPAYQLGVVPRYNLIGKAVFVYWPSGFRVPGIPWLALLPNVGQMRLVR